MNWGRKKKVPPADIKKKTETGFSKSTWTVMWIGALCVLLFFFAAAEGRTFSAQYPPEKASAAADAFGREHTALAAVLGIDAFFEEEAVMAGAFGMEEERWTFSQYLRDAFRTLLYGETG